MATGTFDASADTTSTGMPPIPANHGALDVPPQHSTGPQTTAFGDQAQKVRADAAEKVRDIADEGKLQVRQSLDGIVEAVRDVAQKLETGGVGPLAVYAHQAADAVSGWSSAIDNKSVEELVDDARTLVRRSPAVAVGVALAAGFILTRFFRTTTPVKGY